MFLGINFSNVPPNASALTVHGPQATWETPNFEYWLTHDAFQTPYDKYFNTREQQNTVYSTSANYPWDCRFADGKQLRIRANSCDGEPNCTQVTLPTNTTQFYTLDKFKPFVHAVHVKFDGAGVVYNRSWNTSGHVESGIVLGEAQDHGLVLPLSFVPLIVTALASEAMTND